MAKIRTCRKCGHINRAAIGDELEACPDCGAIYSRVEAALAAGKTVASPGMRASDATKPPGKTQPPNQPPTRDTSTEPLPAPAAGHRRREIFEADSDTLRDLREQSNYPAFRMVVRVFTGFGYLMALAALVGALVWFYSGSPGTGAGSLIIALLFAIMARVFREVSFMVADGCDALVSMAARQGASGNSS